MMTLLPPECGCCRWDEELLVAAGDGAEQQVLFQMQLGSSPGTSAPGSPRCTVNSSASTRVIEDAGRGSSVVVACCSWMMVVTGRNGVPQVDVLWVDDAADSSPGQEDPSNLRWSDFRDQLALGVLLGKQGQQHVLLVHVGQRALTKASVDSSPPRSRNSWLDLSPLRICASGSMCSTLQRAWVALHYADVDVVLQQPLLQVERRWHRRPR